MLLLPVLHATATPVLWRVASPRTHITAARQVAPNRERAESGVPAYMAVAPHAWPAPRNGVPAWPANARKWQPRRIATKHGRHLNR